MCVRSRALFAVCGSANHIKIDVIDHVYLDVSKAFITKSM
jgi:hypothetical protein